MSSHAPSESSAHQYATSPHVTASLLLLYILHFTKIKKMLSLFHIDHVIPLTWI